MPCYTGNRLLAPNGPTRWRVLRMEAIADGLADAGLLLRYETTLPFGRNAAETNPQRSLMR